MRTYIFLVIAIVLGVSIFGVVAPALISEGSDIAVVLGFCLLTATPLLFYSLYQIWKRGNNA